MGTEKWHVQYRGLPIAFLHLGGRDVGNAVTVAMASKFDSAESGYARALMQWGDEAMQHVELVRSSQTQLSTFNSQPEGLL